MNRSRVTSEPYVRRSARAGIGSLIVAATLGLLTADTFAADARTYTQLNLFGDAYDRVRRAYVEPVADEHLIRSAINGLLASLDPDSVFLTPQAYKDLLANKVRVYDGLGLEITMSEGVARVVAPIDGGPAASAGLRTDDLIVDINGTPVYGMNLTETILALQGQAGTTADLVVVRQGTDPFRLALKREAVAEPQVTARSRGNEGYIRIPYFTSTTVAQLTKAVTDLQTRLGQNFEGIVLDLRNTPGGSHEVALQVADAFLTDGVMMSVQGRAEGDSKMFNATPGDILNGKPIVVLVDGGTAGAGEILAGALKDRGRAIAIGMTTFKRGSAQSLVQMGEFGYVQLTTGYYVTPKGASIQNDGIVPETIVEPARVILPEDRFPRRTEATLRGALDVPAGGPAAVATEAAEVDYQLARAFDLLHALALVNQFAAN
jgi:carboxyl-terminal processing protease